MKSHRIPRRARRTVVVCLAFAAVVSIALAFAAGAAARIPPAANAANAANARAVDARERTAQGGVVRAKYPSDPLALQEEGTTILAYPPQKNAPARTARGPLTVVYLHGIHGRAENGCPWLKEGASEVGWLVCPSANEHLPNDTYSWSGSVLAQREVVARAERAAQSRGADPTGGGVLIGFSQGAYVAVNLIGARLGRYRGIVLIGADVTPSRAMLEAAGVERVVLAAGDLDAASTPMRRAAAQLLRDGVRARFVSLGAIGHSYATPNKEALRDAIAWAGGSA